MSKRCAASAPRPSARPSPTGSFGSRIRRAARHLASPTCPPHRGGCGGTSSARSPPRLVTEPWRSWRWTNIDGRLVEFRGLRIAGLGGSLRYKLGPNQYPQAQMGWRALKLEFRVRLKRVRAGRKLDILVTHAPPYGLADAKDSTHVGFVSILRLIQNFQPIIAVHGHVHPYGRAVPERQVKATRVINVVPSRIIEI